MAASRRFSTAAFQVCLASRKPAVARPVERRAGVGLASRRDLAMADDIGDRVSGRNRLRQCTEIYVLGIFERLRVCAFDLYADRKIIAARAAAPRRFARVPCALGAGHELNNQAIAAHEKMRRHSTLGNRAEIRMRGGIETIRKKVDDPRPAEFSRRQADIVYDEELDRAAHRARIAVRRQNRQRALEESSGINRQVWAHCTKKNACARARLPPPASRLT